VHSAITGPDGGQRESKVRGRAIAGYNLGVQSRYAVAVAVAAALGSNPEPRRFHLFAVDIEQVTVIRYDYATGGQHAALPPRCGIHPPRDTATSRGGDREPATDILVST